MMESNLQICTIYSNEFLLLLLLLHIILLRILILDVNDADRGVVWEEVSTSNNRTIRATFNFL